MSQDHQMNHLAGKSKNVSQLCFGTPSTYHIEAKSICSTKGIGIFNCVGLISRRSFSNFHVQEKFMYKKCSSPKKS